MSVASTLRTATELLLVVVAVSLLLGLVLGQPILFGFVETGSMEPTLSAGDGFVAIPGAIAGDVAVGDVVVYQAERLHGGGLTTHRVVDETSAGYVTRGDGNPSTDQADDEPPVKDAQIVAEVLQADGRVVVVPHLGTLVTGIRDALGGVQSVLTDRLGVEEVAGPRGLSVLLFGIAGVGYLVDRWLTGRGEKARRRGPSRETGVDVRVIVGTLAVFVVFVATVSMAVPAGPHEYAFVSSNHDTPGPGVIGVGETETTTHVVSNGGFVPVVAFFETDGDGIAVDPAELRIGPRNDGDATVTLTAPPTAGYYRHFVVEHRYLHLLPTPTIRALYHVHPWLPTLVIDGLLGIPFYLVGIKLVGTGRVRSYARDRPSTVRKLLNRITKS
jgi:signal peptidase